MPAIGISVDPPRPIGGAAISRTVVVGVLLAGIGHGRTVVGRIGDSVEVAVGRGFGALYISGEAGYRARGGRAAEIPFALAAGVTVKRSVMLRGELSGVGSLSAPVVEAVFEPARAESRYLSGGLGLVLLGDPLDIVFAADHVLGGRNALAGTRFSLSVWRSD